MNRALLAIGVVLFPASTVWADAGPVVPGWQFAQAVHRVELLEEQHEYAFVVVRHYTFTQPKGGVESEFVELKPGQPLTLTSNNRDWAELLIVPRSVASRYPTAAELAEAVKSGRIPAARQPFNARETVPSWSGPKVTVTYRVQRTKSGDGLEVVRTSWNPLWQWYVAAVLFSAAVVCGGFWVVRRMARSARRALAEADRDRAPPAT